MRRIIFLALLLPLFALGQTRQTGGISFTPQWNYKISGSDTTWQFGNTLMSPTQFPYLLTKWQSDQRYAPATSGGYVPTSRTLTALYGLIGGGDLSANRSFIVDTANIVTKIWANRYLTQAAAAGLYAKLAGGNLFTGNQTISSGGTDGLYFGYGATFGGYGRLWANSIASKSNSNYGLTLADGYTELNAGTSAGVIDLEIAGAQKVSVQKDSTFVFNKLRLYDVDAITSTSYVLTLNGNLVKKLNLFSNGNTWTNTQLFNAGIQIGSSTGAGFGNYANFYGSSTGYTAVSSANASATNYAQTLQAASGTLAFLSDITAGINLTGPITSVGNATSVAAQTGTGSTFVMNTSPTLITPALGTPTSGVATNLTGLPLTTGVTGVLPSANGGTGINNGSSTITLGGNLATVGAVGTTITSTATTAVTLPTSGTLYGTATGSITSAQMRTSLSDETGTGNAVFSNGPTFTSTLNAATITATGNINLNSASTASSVLNRANTSQASQIVLQTAAANDWYFGTGIAGATTTSDFSIYSFGSASNTFNIAKSTGQITLGYYNTAGIITNNSSGLLSSTTALPSGTTATTQSAGDNSTKVETTAGTLLNISAATVNTLSKTSNYTIVSGDFATGKSPILDLYVDATSGTVAITLPSAATFSGYIIYVTKTDASINAVTVSTVGSGGSLITQYNSGTYMSNGTSWFAH